MSCKIYVLVLFLELISCFPDLKGTIEECNCKIETVDYYNNIKIYPRLKSLLAKDYFRYFRTNLRKPCPFWQDNDSHCAIRTCHVQPCEIPKIVQENCDWDFLDPSLNNKTQQDLKLWARNDFCVVDDDYDADAVFVDLLLNPERYTGYQGKSDLRIWKAIYTENCFRAGNFQDFPKMQEMCLEERVYYRVISGLHASINVHICANYLLNQVSLGHPHGEWGSNPEEFLRRFSSETTKGQGPNWLKNLYFVYLVEMRALEKAATFLELQKFPTGNEAEDWDTQMAVRDLLAVIKQFPAHFRESRMFNGEKKGLKQQFREHFRNVTRIMDCVGCEKCRLWGKLQTRGLGTALKVLFTEQEELVLHRNDIIALFNAFGRLSNSIYSLDNFREMLTQKTEL